jgi:hypothetical protein
MSQPPTQERTPPLSTAQRLHEVCNGFEQAWKAGQRPRIGSGRIAKHQRTRQSNPPV